MWIARLAAVAILSAAIAAPAGAQSRVPPYENDLLRLAEILGAVHYLRGLCQTDEGQTWRSMMQALIEAENPTRDRRGNLIDSFNRGYRGFEQTYHTCNRTAVAIIDRYMVEGADIAQRIASRYGE
jgi:uncharacterized protein (TIGR02301 family)